MAERGYVELVKSLRLANKRCSYKHCGVVDICTSQPPCVFKRAADAIEELLAELTTIRKQFPRWISVEDELPSRYETVLLNIQTCKDSYVTIGDYEPNELRFRDFADRNNQVYCGDIVTHWMPLPTPPKVK